MGTQVAMKEGEDKVYKKQLTVGTRAGNSLSDSPDMDKDKECIVEGKVEARIVDTRS